MLKLVCIFYCCSLLSVAAAQENDCQNDGPCARQYQYCVDSDLGETHVIATDYNTRDQRELEQEVESRLCNLTGAFVCEATAYRASDCGEAPMRSDFNFTGALSKVFWEGNVPEGVKANIRIAFDPTLSLSTHEMNDILVIAGNIAGQNQCPILFELNAKSVALPEAYKGFVPSDDTTLQSLLVYPGNVKLVRSIDFCGNNFNTPKMSDDGGEVDAECTSEPLQRIAIAHSDPLTNAVLLLRGLWHRGGNREDSSPQYELSLSDAGILIPESAVLNGDATALRITPSQCIAILKSLRLENARTME